MARLAHSDRAIVPEAKIVDYLLSARHPGGRAKARFLAGFGFSVENCHALRDAIVAHATANEITASPCRCTIARAGRARPLERPNGASAP